MRRKPKKIKSKGEYITVKIDITDLVKAALKQLKEAAKTEIKDT